jgi:hypothetical protein
VFGGLFRSVTALRGFSTLLMGRPAHDAGSLPTTIEIGRLLRSMDAPTEVAADHVCVYFWDANFEGRWTLVGYHDDGRLQPTRFERYDDFHKRLAAQH